MRQQELIYALKSNGLEFKNEVEELVTFLIHAARPDEALEVRSIFRPLVDQC